MGRFDALNNLEENQVKVTPPKVVPSPAPKQPQNKLKVEDKKPDFMKTRKPENHPQGSSFSTSLNKPEKFSTLIDSRLIKKIKFYAAEKDIKSYQVIDQALSEFFKNNR